MRAWESMHVCDVPRSYVRNDAFILATWFTHYPYVWRDFHTCSCVDTTHVHVGHDSYVRLDPSTCVPWLIHMCDMTYLNVHSRQRPVHSYVWYASFICVPWLIHTLAMAQSLCVTWLIHGLHCVAVCCMQCVAVWDVLQWVVKTTLAMAHTLMWQCSQ